jgi:hypothetical protein
VTVLVRIKRRQVYQALVERVAPCLRHIPDNGRNR